MEHTKVFCTHCGAEIIEGNVEIFLEEPYCDLNCVTAEVIENYVTTSELTEYQKEIDGEC